MKDEIEPHVKDPGERDRFIADINALGGQCGCGAREVACIRRDADTQEPLELICPRCLGKGESGGVFQAVFPPVKVMKERINPLQAAFHEAGHVVIAKAHGIECKEVAILRAGERPRKGHEDYRGSVHYQLEAGDRNRTTNYVAGTIAGPIATFLYKGRTASGRTKLRRTLKTVPLVRVKYSNHPRDVYESTIDGLLFDLGGGGDNNDMRGAWGVLHNRRYKNPQERLLRIIAEVAQQLANPMTWAKVEAVAQALMEYGVLSDISDLIEGVTQPSQVNHEKALNLLLEHAVCVSESLQKDAQGRYCHETALDILEAEGADQERTYRLMGEELARIRNGHLRKSQSEENDNTRC